MKYYSSVYRYIVTLEESFWEGDIHKIYITEAENPKDAIIKVMNFVNDERFDSIDKDWSIAKCHESLTESNEYGYLCLSKAKDFLTDSDSWLDFEAYIINDFEPKVRLLEKKVGVIV